MLNNGENNNVKKEHILTSGRLKDRDALDALARWIKKNCGYETIKFTAQIQQGKVETIKLYQGDRRISLRAGAEVK